MSLRSTINSPDRRLVFEMATAREEHRDAELVARIDRILITLGATWLNDGRDANLVGKVDVVSEGEERIRGQDRTFGSIARF